MVTKLPVWARKPQHKNTVVATSKGWVVEETGELLVSVRNLDQRLKEIYDAPSAEPKIEDGINIFKDELTKPIEAPANPNLPTQIAVVTPVIDVQKDSNDDSTLKAVLEGLAVKDAVVVPVEPSKVVIQSSADTDKPSERSTDEVVEPQPLVEEYEEPATPVKRKPGRPKKAIKSE